METTQQIVNKCCVCGRIEQKSGWRQDPDNPEALYSHGYCLRCEREAALQLGREMARAHAMLHLPCCAPAA